MAPPRFVLANFAAAAVVNATRESRRGIVTTVRALSAAVASLSDGPLLVLVGAALEGSDRGQDVDGSPHRVLRQAG